MNISYSNIGFNSISLEIRGSSNFACSLPYASAVSFLWRLRYIIRILVMMENFYQVYLKQH